MIQPLPLSQLIAADPLASIQEAIVATLTALMPGVAVRKHPGKVDLSELIAKSVVSAPGIGIGWSRVRRIGIADGSYSAAVEWTAYIVAEAKAIDNKRVEKEAIGLAIGQQLLRILADDLSCFWGRTGIMPPEEEPRPELKPFFTIRDQSHGTAYYTVTWTQIAADIGETHFPQDIGRANPDNGTIDYDDEAAIDAIKRFIPAAEVDEDA